MSKASKAKKVVSSKDSHRKLLLAGSVASILAGGFWYSLRRQQAQVMYVGARGKSNNQERSPMCLHYGKEQQGRSLPNRTLMLDNNLNEKYVVRVNKDYVYVLGGHVGNNGSELVRVYKRGSLDYVGSFRTQGGDYYFDDMRVNDQGDVFVIRAAEETGTSAVLVYGKPYNTNATPEKEIGVGVLKYPKSLAVDNQNVYVLDDDNSNKSNKLYVFDLSSGNLSQSITVSESMSQLALDGRRKKLYAFKQAENKVVVYRVVGGKLRFSYSFSVNVNESSSYVFMLNVHNNGNLVFTTQRYNRPSVVLKEVDPQTGYLLTNKVLWPVGKAVSNLDLVLDYAGVAKNGDVYMPFELVDANYKMTGWLSKFDCFNSQSILPSPIPVGGWLEGETFKLLKPSLLRGKIGMRFTKTFVLVEKQPNTIKSMSWSVNGLPAGITAEQCFQYPQKDQNSPRRFGCRLSGTYRGRKGTYLLDITFTADDGSQLKYQTKLVFSDGSAYGGNKPYVIKK